MKIRFNLGIALCLLVSIQSLAQTNQPSNSDGILPNVIPPSTEAASLGKFGEWPVSEYTGIPDISVPLYSIKVGNFDLPIQLSYHAGGIKVDEVSSWVGAGWALNAGGAITRTIVGIADDWAGGLSQENLQAGGNFLQPYYDLTDTNSYILFRKIADQSADGEPDLYYLNISGLAAKFYVDSAGNFISIPASNIKILSSPFFAVAGGTKSSTQWVVADDKGNVYYFGSNTAGVPSGMVGVENSYSGAAPSHVTFIKPTGWYITKIITASRADTIYFDYSQKSEQYWLAPVLSFKSLTNATVLPALGTGSYSQYLKSDQLLWDGNNTSGLTHISETEGVSTLSDIRWRGGMVKFASNTPRQDMITQIGYSNMLDSVYIYNTAGTIIKAFSFNYSYINQRYFLNSLIESGPGGSPSLTQTFGYINPGGLPAKGSYSQDFWGFFNGAANTTLLPPSTQMPPIASSFLTANRQPDSNYMQYGTLNSITYPTGGRTSFAYTANRYIAGSVVVGSPPSAPIVGLSGGIQGDTTLPFAQSLSFQVPFAQNNASLQINYINYAHPPQANMSTLPYASLYEQLTNGSLLLVGYWNAYDNFPTTTVTPNSFGLYNYSLTVNNISLQQGTYILVASDTCLKFNACMLNSSQPVWAYCNASINLLGYGPMPPTDTTQLPPPIAGGLRVTGITDYGADGRFLNEKQYSYGIGNLLMYPSYVVPVQQDVTLLAKTYGIEGGSGPGIPNCGPLWANMVQETSTSQTVLGLTQGSIVGYPQVTETEVDSLSNTNGHTNYVFSYFQDSTDLITSDPYWGAYVSDMALVPFTPINSFDFKRGLLLEKDIYKNVSGSSVKIHAEKNSYNFNDYNPTDHYTRVRGLRLEQLRYTMGAGYDCGPIYDGYSLPGSGSFSPDFAYGVYDLVTGWVQHTAAIDTTFDQNGQNPVISVTQYVYDNSVHMNATRTTVNKSNGDIVTSLVNYPQDYAAGTPFIDSLVAHNVVSLPIETIKYQTDPSSNTTILSGTISTYKPDGKGLPDIVKQVSNTQPIAPGSFKFSNTPGTGIWPYNTLSKSIFSPDPSFVNRASFVSYDNFGNILSDQKVGDFLHSYLWDYQSVYPIAEVKNAAQSDIAYTSFEADGTGNWHIPDTTRIRTYAMTGSACYGLNSGNTITASGLNSSKTYTVSYWSRAASMTVNGTSGVQGGTVTYGGYTWNYYEHTIIGATSISVSGAAAIDELRLFPKGSLMTTYTYTPLIGMTSQCTPTNYITYYSYDGLGRLNVVKDLRGDIVKTYQYNYQK